jgi:hypothetical protein
MALGYWPARGPERPLLGEIGDIERRCLTTEEMRRAGDKYRVVPESRVPNYNARISNKIG